MTAAAAGDPPGPPPDLPRPGWPCSRRISSAALALAPDACVLIGARAVHGAGAAMIMPMALALLDARSRPRGAAGRSVLRHVTTLAAVLGPFSAGRVTQSLADRGSSGSTCRWRSARLPRSSCLRAQTAGWARRWMCPACCWFTAAALGLVLGLVRGNSAGWGARDSPAGSPQNAGRAGLRRLGAPAARPCALRLFRPRAFSAGNAAVFLLSASLTGAIFLCPSSSRWC